MKEKLSITVRSGSETRCYCRDCQLEWEICLEPNMAQMDYETSKANGAGVRSITYCPHCGGNNLDETT